MIISVRWVVLLSALALSTISGGAIGQAVFSGSGASPAGIQATVDSFRAALGALNPNTSGSFGSGRREINWDGVPDALSAPNSLPANFFNVNSPRGVVFSTPGTGFQVSARAASGTPVCFGNINSSYATTFQTFSPERLFAALGSNIVDVQFFVPGSATPALSRGFGAVFTDVDAVNTTSITLFDSNNNSLGQFFVPASQGGGLSFLGIVEPTANIARVRITSGNTALGPTDNGTTNEIVVMDDFIYGEPVVVALVTRYRLYSPGTYEHLYTTDQNEYNTLPVCCAWQPEGAIYRVFNGAGTYDGVNAVPYYRLYNPSSYQHLWTTYASEYSFLPTVGWHQEGIDGYILPSSAVGAVPLYRLYLNAQGGLHLWTTDANERNYLIANAGWWDEGISGYVIPLP